MRVRAPRYSISSLDLTTAFSRKRSMRKASIGTLVAASRDELGHDGAGAGAELEAVGREAELVVDALVRRARARRPGGRPACAPRCRPRRARSWRRA